MATRTDENQISDEDLRSLTGIDESEEQRMAGAANPTNKYRDAWQNRAAAPAKPKAEVQADRYGGNMRVPAAPSRPLGSPNVASRTQDSPGTAKPGGGTLGREGLNKAESGSMIGGFYNAAGVGGLGAEGGGAGKNKLATKLQGINRRRKVLAAGGIGGFAGLALAAMMITPVWRIPALMSDLDNRLGAQVKDTIEVRAERIVLLYLISKAGGNPTNYVITGSPISDLYNTFSSRRMEKRIFEKTGIRFYKASDGLVHIEFDGRDAGRIDVNDWGKINWPKIQAILDQGTINNRREFKLILRAITNHYFASRHAKLLKIRFLWGGSYGAPRAPAAEEGASVEERVAKEVEELTAQQINEGAAGGVDLLDDALNCTINGDSSCDTFSQEEPDAELPDPNSEASGQDSSNGSSSEVENSVREAADQAEQEAVRDRKGGFTSRLVEKVLTKVVGAAVAKTIVKAIPYLGWIDLAATLQHVVGTVVANHLIHRIPIILRENVYGTIFTAWEGYSSQINEGKMPLSMVSALSAQIGGAEKAQGYKLVYDGKDGGIKIDPPVGSDKGDPFGDIVDSIYNSWFVRWGPARGLLEIWYYTVGKLLGVVSDVGGDAISWLMEKSGFNARVELTLKTIFGDNWKEEFGKAVASAVMWVYGITIDPLARGAAMFNNLFAGAAVALNYSCRMNLGCRTLTDKDNSFFGMYIQEKKREEMALTPLKDRLFSKDVPDSLTNTLIRNAPADSSPTGAVSALFKQAANLPSSIVKSLSPKARAADYTTYSEAAGVQWYGWTPTDLEQGVASQVRQQKAGEVDCPKVDATKGVNACQADSNVITGLTCWVDPENCPDYK